MTLKEFFSISWKDFNKNKVCVFSFLVAIIVMIPAIFFGFSEQFVYWKWGIYIIAIVIFMIRLFGRFKIFYK